ARLERLLGPAVQRLEQLARIVAPAELVVLRIGQRVLDPGVRQVARVGAQQAAQGAVRLGSRRAALVGAQRRLEFTIIPGCHCSVVLGRGRSRPRWWPDANTPPGPLTGRCGSRLTALGGVTIVAAMSESTAHAVDIELKR